MENDQKDETTSESGFRPEKCPDCGSTQIRKFGFAMTRKEGKKQRFQCYNCGKTFYGDNQ